MAPRPDGNETTGIASLDELVGGGLVAGDNVVWLAEAGAPAIACCRAFAAAAPEATAWIGFRDPPSELPGGVEVLRLDPADAARDPGAAAAAIVAVATRRPRLVVDGLSAVHARGGAEPAVDLYRRCCPRLFDLGVVACWPLEREEVGPTVAGRIRRVAQCVFELRTDAVRVAKAEGRPSRVQGAMAELHPAGPGAAPTVGRDLVAGRLGEGLRRLRRDRSLTQRQLAELAGVTPAAISQAEAGRRGLSLETLLPLCDALGIGLDDLLGTGPRDRQVVARRDRRPLGEGITALFDDPGAGAQAYRVELAPGATGRPPFVHKAAELVLVARGLVLVDLGDDTPVMRAGDALRATAAPIGSWTNLGVGPAELFWLAEPAVP
jgi:transcriptional regulator with XRE-family HTH domain